MESRERRQTVAEDPHVTGLELYNGTALQQCLITPAKCRDTFVIEMLHEMQNRVDAQYLMSIVNYHCA